MIDVVIPYKETGSNELNWATRSLFNINYVNKIHVVSSEYELADWGKRSMYLNQIAKYFYACLHLNLTDTFLASNDDFFVMKKWTPTNYNQGSLEDHINRRRSKDVYTRSLIATKEWLEGQGMPTLSYELHTPFVYDKSRLAMLINIMPKDKPMQIRSLYGNYFKIDSEFMEDVKNPKDPAGMTLISTDNVTFKGSLGDYIRANL